MDADKLARLLATMRGDNSPASSKTGVAGVSGVTGVAGYTSKPQQLHRLHRLHLKNGKREKSAIEGVTDGVSKPPALFADVVMTIPADDPFEVARSLINMARAQDAAGELPVGRSYRFRLTDQHGADRRNAEAMRAHSTDRFCGCGALARCEWIVDGRPTWQCDDCTPTTGRA